MTSVLIRRGNVDTETDTGWVTQRHKEKTAAPRPRREASEEMNL